MAGSWRHYLESLPFTPPPDPGGSIVILSAHPDDEVLSVGAWLAAQVDRAITFVTATDGEASHPNSPTVTPEELSARRPEELVEALAELGFDSPNIYRLGLPDGALAANIDALRISLAPLLEDAQLVLAPFEHDGHPDHDALGRVAREVLPATSVLWQFPVWTWAWTAPHDQDWSPRIRRLTCSSTQRAAKRRAIEAFSTQVRPLSEDPHDRAVVDHRLLNHARFSPEAVVI